MGLRAASKYKLVRCPKCSQLFITSTIKRVKCRYCNRSFEVMKHLVASSDKLDELREHRLRKELSKSPTPALAFWTYKLKE